MVSLTRPLQSLPTESSPDAAVASVWHELNRTALHVGLWLAPVSMVGYTVGLALTRRWAYVALILVAVGIVTSCASRLRDHRHDSEVPLLLGVLGLVIAVTLVPPMVRGALAGATVVVAVAGMLILPARVQTRFVIVTSALALAPLGWPYLGLATWSGAASILVVTLPSLLLGGFVAGYVRRALDESERKRIEIFRSVPVGLFRSAPSGDLIDANPALALMLGHEEPDDLIGSNIADLHEDREDWDTLAALLDDGGEPRRFAHRMLRRHSTALWVRGFARAIRDAGGAVLYYEGAIEDVTQRHEAEEISRVHAERFKNVFERAPIGIWEEDYSQVGLRLEELRAAGVEDLRDYLVEHPEETHRLLALIDFLNVNPAGIALIGAPSKEEALAAVLPETAPAAVVEGFIEEFIAIWDDRDQMFAEIQGATADGATTDLALSWAAGRHADGLLDLTRVVIAIQDIAIIKQAERELAALVESKNDLMASVSHELRTPITTILGMAFELRDHGHEFSKAEERELIEMIADQSRELSNIVEDLLVAARTEAGTLAIRPEVVDIETEMSRIMSNEPGEPQLMIDEPTVAWADPLRVRQILRDLLTNAARYGGDRVSVEAETVGDKTVIRVRDNGLGIPRSEREMIFEPYVRSAGEAALPGSLGLGLPVSRSLARLMNGDLVYRHDGSSLFELSLPATSRSQS